MILKHLFNSGKCFHFILFNVKVKKKTFYFIFQDSRSPDIKPEITESHNHFYDKLITSIAEYVLK